MRHTRGSSLSISQSTRRERNGGRTAVPMKATPIPGKDATPQEITRRSWEPTRNTCPFNVTGHPAISMPCGIEDGRPIGLMLVGRHYAEETIYRAAAAFEGSGDWMTF